MDDLSKDEQRQRQKDLKTDDLNEDQQRQRYKDTNIQRQKDEKTERPKNRNKGKTERGGGSSSRTFDREC